MTKPRIVNCPTCEKPVSWTDENEYRPFCSERCKLIDFGDWATGKNTIAGEPVYPIEDDSEEKLQ
ncbi:MAG: DNA gyrase inhibitor YacG [Pseudomonadales bacterium]|nr:DNA gyrase inhibitor YacG [Pseudomonadales bacterium]